MTAQNSGAAGVAAHGPHALDHGRRMEATDGQASAATFIGAHHGGGVEEWPQERRAGDGACICEYSAIRLQWHGALSDSSKGRRCRDALGEDRTVDHDVGGRGAGRVQEHGGDDCCYACQEIRKRYCLDLSI